MLGAGLDRRLERRGARVSAGSAGSWTWRATRAAHRGLAELVTTTLIQEGGVIRRRRLDLGRRAARRRSRRTATRSAAGAVGGAPRGSEPQPERWPLGARPAPRTAGDIARSALNRQPAIIAFLAGLFGPYPFTSAGSIVDDRATSASRSRTRPGRSTRAASSRTGDRRGRRGRRPRARAPVGRRPGVASRPGSTSGSTRASPPTPSGSGASGAGARRRRQRSTERRARRAAGVLGGRDRRPRAGRTLFDRAGLRPRRHDAARAAPDDR